MQAGSALCTAERRSFRKIRTGRTTFSSTSISMVTTVLVSAQAIKPDGQASLRELSIFSHGSIHRMHCAYPRTNSRPREHDRIITRRVTKPIIANLLHPIGPFAGCGTQNDALV